MDQLLDLDLHSEDGECFWGQTVSPVISVSMPTCGRGFNPAAGGVREGAGCHIMA